MWLDLNGNFYKDTINEQFLDITDKDLKCIKNSLYNILRTQKCEIPGKPEFGNSLSQYLFQLITPELNIAFEEDLKIILKKYEPRISITNAELIENPDYNEVICNIDFYIIADKTQREFNFKTTFFHLET